MLVLILTRKSQTMACVITIIQGMIMYWILVMFLQYTFNSGTMHVYLKLNRHKTQGKINFSRKDTGVKIHNEFIGQFWDLITIGDSFSALPVLTKT